MVFIICAWNNSVPDGTVFYPYLVPKGTGRAEVKYILSDNSEN
jgi:hypothetical protein